MNIKELSNQYLEETIEKIQELVRIDSVRDEINNSSTSLCGVGVAEALDCYLAMAKQIGMRTYRDPEGVYGYAEIGPESGDMIGILGHVDVVPIGDEKQWTEAAPFSGDIVDNKIIGRGSLDDKGPMVINLMAIKLLIENGFEFKKRVRIIVGCAEETTWEGINKYVKIEEIPTMSYSPDSNFPLINAEKAMMEFDVYDDTTSYDFKVESLGAYNAVADYAKYIGDDVEKVIEELDKLGFEYNKDNGEVIVIGKSAHSKDCHLGTNAITRLSMAMFNANIHSKTTDFLANYVKETSFGEIILGEEVKDDISGNLTVNIGNIEVNSSGERVGFNLRVPVLKDEKEILSKMTIKIEENGLKVRIREMLDKLYLPIEHPLVDTLWGVYKEVTKDEGTLPQSTGGVTYSRAIDNCCAFGMVFDKFDMISIMHQPNECLEIKFIQPALEIYAKAIYKLTK